jgi:glycosyltransferase involved in cell wall biosynthesis
MVRVGLDLSALDPAFKSHALRGIGRYVTELRRFIGDYSDGEIEVGYFDHHSLSRESRLDKAVSLVPYGRTSIRQHLLYPRRLKEGAMREFSFVHYPAHMDAPAFSPIPYVLTVLDLIPHLLSSLYAAKKSNIRFRFARKLEVLSIKHATLLLAISETTASDLVRVLGVPRDRIVVTPLGVDKAFFDVFEQSASVAPDRAEGIRVRLGIPPVRPLVLYVGGHDERKNIGNLIGIVRDVIDAQRERGETPPLLVLSGRIAAVKEQKRLESLLRQYGMEGDTITLGYVGDEDLRELYSISALFLFPSLYEGFGLPVLEAMASGLPVVASNTSSIPEVVGDAGVLFNPLRIEEGAKAALQVLNSPDLWRNLRTAGVERARMFTWDRTGRETLAAYRRAEEMLRSGALRAPEREWAQLL